MKIELYTSMGGSKVKITKNPTGKKELTGSLIANDNDTISYTNPVFQVNLSYSEIGNYEYAKLFGKYYFINDYLMLNSEIMNLVLEMDYLKSFESQILDTDVILSYESDYYNPYVPDPRVVVNSKAVRTVYRKSLPKVDNNFILGVNGDNTGAIDPNFDPMTAVIGTAWYSCSSNQVNEVIRNLYNTTFMENLDATLFNKKAEGLLSLHYYPHGYYGYSEPSTSEITIGNVGMGVMASRCGGISKHEVESIYIKPHFNNFLDYGPYTSVSINIAGVGLVELDPKMVIGKTIKVKFAGRYFLGDGVAKVYADDVLILTSPVQMTTSIPLNIESAVDTLMGVGSSLIAPALATAGAIAAGPVGAIVAGTAGSAISSFTPTRNSTGGGTSSFESWDNTVEIVVTRPDSYISNSNYTNVLNPSGRSGKINNFYGYLVASAINPSNLTNRFADQITSILKSGFIK